jgi:hypothetical protein
VYGQITDMTYDKYRASLGDKALGQIELVRRGLSSINPRGSFTLITGVLFDRPIVTGSAAAAANGAVEGFARQQPSNSRRSASMSSARPCSPSQLRRADTCSQVRHRCRPHWSQTPTSGRSKPQKRARYIASTRHPKPGISAFVRSVPRLVTMLIV